MLSVAWVVALLVRYRESALQQSDWPGSQQSQSKASSCSNKGRSMAGPASLLHTSVLASRSLAFCPTRDVVPVGFTSSANHSIGRQANSASFSRAKRDQSLLKSPQIVAARTESADLPLGDTIPNFQVPQWLHEQACSMLPCTCTWDTFILYHLQLLEPLTGELKHLQHISGSNGTLIVFMCNHCPFVIHLRGRLYVALLQC